MFMQDLQRGPADGCDVTLTGLERPAKIGIVGPSEFRPGKVPGNTLQAFTSWSQSRREKRSLCRRVAAQDHGTQGYHGPAATPR